MLQELTILVFALLDFYVHSIRLFRPFILHMTVHLTNICHLVYLETWKIDDIRNHARSGSEISFKNVLQQNKQTKYKNNRSEGLFPMTSQILDFV